MKTIDKLSHKYALNINQIRGPSKTKNLDFKNLNKGFYDDIEKDDIAIKQNQKELKRLKNTSLKEFIYTNKEIPDKWKKKTNYENDLLNLMVMDEKILTYVGTCPKNEILSNNRSYNAKTVTKKNKSYDNKKNWPNINNRYSTKKTEKTYSKGNEEIKFNNNLDSEINNKNTITEEYNNDNSVSKANKIKIKNKSKAQLNDKVISNILEDFKTVYPIKEKLQELYTFTNYYNSKKNDINENNTEGKNLKEPITSNSTKKNINNIHNMYNSTATNGRNTFFNSIINQQQFKRRNVFRQNVFNNLAATNTYITDKKNEKKKLKIDVDENKRPFLGGDYHNFIKKVEINNPIINKNLESINFYGPYFSHCPPCYNRNLNYYKNLEINQCLHIISHIKKCRKKNLFLNIKKSPNKEKNEPLFDNEMILDSNSLKSNENNDYIDSL